MAIGTQIAVIDITVVFITSSAAFVTFTVRLMTFAVGQSFACWARTRF